MTPSQAEEILNNYWGSIKDMRPKAIVQSIRDLPCSPGKIRYAHFVYGEWLIESGNLTKKMGDRLVGSYSRIHTLFAENPEPINRKYREYLEKLDQGVITTDFKISDILAPAEWSIEYHNFLADCQGNYRQDAQASDHNDQ